MSATVTLPSAWHVAEGWLASILTDPTAPPAMRASCALWFALRKVRS